MNNIIYLPIWMVFGYILMSFIEHHIHRYHMHKRGWINRFDPNTFIGHHLIHHPGYMQDFTSCNPKEDEKVGLWIKFIHSVGVTCIPLAILALFAWVPALGIFIMIIIHTIIWNTIHEEMHLPQGRFFSKWTVYRYLLKNHLIHHWHPNKNFNAAFPLADWLLGTLHKPTVKEMEKLS